ATAAALTPSSPSPKDFPINSSDFFSIFALISAFFSDEKSSGIQRPNSAHSPTLRLSTDGGTPPGPYVLTAHCIVYANAALPAPFPNFPPVITDTVPPT